MNVYKSYSIMKKTAEMKLLMRIPALAGQKVSRINTITGYRLEKNLTFRQAESFCDLFFTSRGCMIVNNGRNYIG